ncbi:MULTISPECIES: nuclear transport factor 2 family protein [Halorussus]|nr:nuclear transport factor 2 family protein [Halorussus sp. JP-T4]
MTEATDLARAYYEAIDAGDYDRFADLLAPDVVHERPDRTIEGRETLVRFMRDDRPNKNTAHDVEAVYRGDRSAAGDADGSANAGSAGDTDGVSDADEVAVRGRLRDAEGSPMFAFVDVFDVENGSGRTDGGESDERPRITRIRTYTQ